MSSVNRRLRHEGISSHGPIVYTRPALLDKPAVAPGDENPKEHAMDHRTKELIAVGASITANCQPCLTYHVAKARESGAAEQDIADAMAVGAMVRKGSTAKMERFASTVLEVEPAPAAATEDKDCSCR